MEGVADASIHGRFHVATEKTVFKGHIATSYEKGQSSATSPTVNSSLTGATIGSVGKDVKTFIDILTIRLRRGRQSGAASRSHDDICPTPSDSGAQLLAAPLDDFGLI
ncbi:hypothetical protein PIB30_040342 [Stylosanthes scabra]|uniref:Uncharacterized protein n=1 Tax=Stylosanthes scabra TaxID=79078 RepID=A0ABU6UD83_9FABA|nr:hypothetical protein [Stylosanthes scabra]